MTYHSRRRARTALAVAAGTRVGAGSPARSTGRGIAAPSASRRRTMRRGGMGLHGVIADRQDPLRDVPARARPLLPPAVRPSAAGRRQAASAAGVGT
jgi:hypothetical protein